MKLYSRFNLKNMAVRPNTEVVAMGPIVDDLIGILNTMVQILTSKCNKNVLVARALVYPSGGAVIS